MVGMCAKGHFLIPPILHVVVVVLYVCADAYMWSSEDNFWERLQGSKSGHQACKSSTCTH